MTTQPYSAVESEVGISSYMSTEHLGFAAVLKARYSDFVVHEGTFTSCQECLHQHIYPFSRTRCPVNQDGQMARLESLLPDDTCDPSQEESRKRKRQQTDQKTDVPLTREEQWTMAQSGLTECVGPEASLDAIALLQYWEGSPEDEAHDKFVTMPIVADKEARRDLHELIRSQLSFCARADTLDGRVRIWHKRFEKNMPNYGKFDGPVRNSSKRAKWPSDRPDFLQFVMYKENMDTGYACKELIRRSSQRGKVRIGYAGMKDKRGVTSQFCTLYRQEPQSLLGINKGGRGGGNTTNGGVEIMRVGNFSYVRNELQLGMLNGNRFDVVLRNVDVADQNSDRIPETKKCLEAAALALREHGFINYFGMQRFGKYHDTHKVGICIIKGDFSGAVDIIMEPKSDEQPRTANAREKWARRFEKIHDKADAADKEKAESDSARDVLRDMGRYMACEVAILNSLIIKPLDYRRAFSCIAKSMRSMFLHALQSYVWNHVASFRIDKLGREILPGDLVLIEDKSEAEGGSGTSGLVGKSVKIVDEADVANKKYDIADVVLPLVGTKVKYPTNESGALFDSLLADHSITKQHFVKVQDRELALGGDYRKVVCKPTDVDFEIIEYCDPLQPLIKTDLMKLDESQFDVSKSEGERERKDILLGMVVGFTLPPSSYATITLRELMKRPTSSAYQRQLKLEGRCEGELSFINNEDATKECS
jgi:tRNA pseudouridine13 synthase